MPGGEKKEGGIGGEDSLDFPFIISFNETGCSFSSSTDPTEPSSPPQKEKAVDRIQGTPFLK